MKHIKLPLQENYGVLNSIEKKNIIKSESSNEETKEKYENKDENKNKEDKENKDNVENENKEEIELASTNVKTEVVESNVKTKYTNTYDGVQVKNESKCTIDSKMLNIDDVRVNNKNIIIYHTHTCESYTPSEKYNYNSTRKF